MSADFDDEREFVTEAREDAMVDAADREAVTIEPGIYSMPNEAYHAEPDHLSSTTLKGYMPEHYSLGGSPEALAFGTFFHTVVLEPENLSEYVVLDAAKIGLKADGTPAANPTMTVAWKKAVAHAATNGQAVVSQADWDRAHRMAEAVRAHPAARELLHDGEGSYEESVFAVDESGVRHKARFDRRIAGRIIDLKSTTAKPSNYALTRATLDYGYDLSAAHYLHVAELAGLDAEEFTLVFVGKEDPFPVVVCHLSDDFIARGRTLRDLAVERATNPDAPRYFGADEALTLHPPGYAQVALPTDYTISPDFTWSLNDYS